MKVEFADSQGLESAEFDPRKDAGLGPALTKAFRHRLEFIRSCHTEQDIRAMKSLHFEKLKGKRSHQHAIKLKHDGKRLIFQIIDKGDHKAIRIDEVGDYH